MDSREEELERFKTQIDLREYAASVGYAEEPRSSCRTSVVMRKESGDKVVIARDATDGHYVYFSVRSDADNGSIVDFIQKRGGGSLGNVRQILRPWLSPSFPTAPRRFAEDLEPTTRDISRVRARLEAMTSVESLPEGHPYLVKERLLSPPLLAHPRFASRIFLDQRGNAVFPHFDRTSGGTCGYEIKGSGFSGFAPGGTKGLWASLTKPEDSRLVIAESAIDALSWAALHPDAVDTRYMSTGGAISPAQSELLTSAMQRLPQPGHVVLALDNDAAGHKLAEQIAVAFEKAARRDLELVVDLPPTLSADWNDMLRGFHENRADPGFSR